MIHIHYHKKFVKQRMHFKWRIVEKCRCGHERERYERIHIRDATPQERREESENSKTMRWL